MLGLIFLLSLYANWYDDQKYLPKHWVRKFNSPTAFECSDPLCQDHQTLKSSEPTTRAKRLTAVGEEKHVKSWGKSAIEKSPKSLDRGNKIDHSWIYDDQYDADGKNSSTLGYTFFEFTTQSLRGGNIRKDKWIMMNIHQRLHLFACLLTRTLRLPNACRLRFAGLWVSSWEGLYHPSFTFVDHHTHNDDEHNTSHNDSHNHANLSTSRLISMIAVEEPTGMTPHRSLRSRWSCTDHTAILKCALFAFIRIFIVVLKCSRITKAEEVEFPVMACDDGSLVIVESMEVWAREVEVANNVVVFFDEAEGRVSGDGSGFEPRGEWGIVHERSTVSLLQLELGIFILIDLDAAVVRTGDGEVDVILILFFLVLC